MSKTIDEILEEFVFPDWVDHVDCEESYEEKVKEMRGDFKREILALLPEKKYCGCTTYDPPCDHPEIDNYNQAIDDCRSALE